jgi:hypothetical protein
MRWLDSREWFRDEIVLLKDTSGCRKKNRKEIQQLEDISSYIYSSFFPPRY